MAYKYAPWFIVAAALLWAVDAPFRKFLTEDLSSSAIVLGEHIIIFFFVLPFLVRGWHELKRLGIREWGAVVFIGAGGSALATVFFTQSFRYINPSVAILLQKLQPFIAILLAVWVLKESLPKRFYWWAAAAIAGAYVVSFPQIVPGSLEGEATGVAFALLAAFFWGGSTVMGRFVLSRLSWPMMTAVRFITALLFLLILSLWQGTIYELGSITVRDGIYLFIIALIVGFAALALYYRGLKETRASVATIGELLFPFAAVVVNWIVLDAVLAWQQIAGGIVLLWAMARVVDINYESMKKEANLPVQADEGNGNRIHQRVTGRVIQGDRIGRTLGYPTANLDIPADSVSDGVYACWVTCEGDEQRKKGIAVAGVLGKDGRKKFEVYIIGFQRDIYGKVVQVDIVEKIRDIVALAPDDPALADLIQRDVQRVQGICRG